MFVNRTEAGARLARQLAGVSVAPAQEPVVLALPRGGLPVAYEVARRLGAPLDAFIVRKIGAPLSPELGVGAIAEGGGLYLNASICLALDVTLEDLAGVVAREHHEIERRVRSYRGGRALLPVQGRTVILVDDGVATGGTARAAVGALRSLEPARIVVAAPVIARPAAAMLSQLADEVVAVVAPDDLVAIGVWYRDFHQVTDDEVARWLARGRGDGEGLSPPA